MADIKKITEFVDGFFNFMKANGWEELTGEKKDGVLSRYERDSRQKNIEKVLQKDKFRLLFTDRNNLVPKWYLILLDKGKNNKANYDLENMEFHNDGTVSWVAGENLQGKSAPSEWQRIHQQILETYQSEFSHVSFSEIYNSLNIIYTAVMAGVLKHPQFSNLERPMQNLISLLNSKKQIILQGAPGTGKTYSTAELAVRMIDGKADSDRKVLMTNYRRLVEEKRIFFTTFHPSLDYEEFMEGYKPNGEEGFVLQEGIFKKACEAAQDLFDEEAAQKLKKLSIEAVLSQLCEKLQADKTTEITSFDGSITYAISFDSTEGYEPRIKFKPTNGNPEKYRSLTHIKDKYYEYNNQAKIGNYPYPRALIKYMIATMNLIDPTELETIQENAKEKPVILIIDEINRGHISKIFGELITLLEADKRRGAENAMSLTLPYSKESFTVPPNLYIIGTMNTSDRTIGYIDYALRRRFAFVTIPTDETMVSNLAKDLFGKVSNIVKDNLAPEFEFNDLMIGHSYFMAEDKDVLQMKLEYEIRPLLLEYLKDGILVGGEELKSAIKALSVL